MRLWSVHSAILVITFAVLAQASWREAYERADYGSAAALLHPEWMDAMRRGQVKPDLAVVAALGRLYETGRGVEQDPVLACATFEFGVVESGLGSGVEHPLTSELVAVEIERAATCPPAFEVTQTK